MEKNDKRFSLLSSLRHNPPFWFHHALAYCQFERSQVAHLLESDAVSPDEDLYEIFGTNSLSSIQCAIECDLIEPIFRSTAEYNGNRFHDLIKLLQETAESIGSTFPWMFLAYFGASYQNLSLVKRCLLIINEEKKAGKIQDFEVGMSYQVWRFLVKSTDASNLASCVSTGGQGDEEWTSAFLKLPLVKHDWSFVHLASAYGDAECLEILLNQPCNQNREVLRAATKVEGFTPLHLAAYHDHGAIATLLLKHADKFDPAAASGAPPSGRESAPEESLSQHIPRDRIFKRSPLHIAASNVNIGSGDVLSILTDKWGNVGVDLPDRFGITALHLAAIPRIDGSTTALEMLLAVSQNPYQRVCKDFALQKAALLRLFRETRRYIDDAATSNSLFIPSPASIIYYQFYWFAVGFTFLHVIAIYGKSEQFYAVLRHHSPEDSLVHWAARDCHGLTAVDYAESYKKFNSFLEDKAVKKIAAVRRAIQLIRTKATGQIMNGSQSLGEVRKLHNVYRMGTDLLSGDYENAVSLSVWQSSQLFVHLINAAGSWKWAVDAEVWDHLEWALDKALQPGISPGSVLPGGPRLHPSQAEHIVLQLAVHRNILHGKSTKQRCLQWAIEKRMAGLAEELVKDKECELVSVVPGSNHEESPLARASKSKVAKDMPGLLTAMELREDVKRRWFEDRQVYVDYANTLLVGAVLIAGLAFAGWLQPPRGYMDIGVIDMKRHTMRVFVHSSSLAFFLGMGTMVAGATGAMPFAIGAGELIRARDRVHRSIVIASILLVASIVCLSISFAAALLAVLPGNSHNFSIFAFLVVNGLLLCGMLGSFLRRLQGLNRLWLMPHLTNVKLWERCRKLLSWPNCNHVLDA